MEERVFDGFSVFLPSQEAIHQPLRVQMRPVHDLQMIYMRLQFVVSPTAWGVFVVLHALHGLRFLLTLHSKRMYERRIKTSDPLAGMTRSGGTLYGRVDLPSETI